MNCTQHDFERLGRPGDRLPALQYCRLCGTLRREYAPISTNGSPYVIMSTPTHGPPIVAPRAAPGPPPYHAPPGRATFDAAEYRRALEAAGAPPALAAATAAAVKRRLQHYDALPRPGELEPLHPKPRPGAVDIGGPPPSVTAAPE